MAKQYLEIGSTPGSEPCAQVGQPNYETMARIECSVYINYLRRVFGKEPQGALLRTKRNQHDFGSYLEVICEYDSRLEASVDYAFKADNEAPEVWDEVAKNELELNKYQVKDPADDRVENFTVGSGQPYTGIG